jgi:hypothetical protein
MERIVAASDDYPTIDTNSSIDIELSEGNVLFYRMEIKGMSSPLKFEVTYDVLEADKSNLVVLVSSTNQTPNS